MLGFVVDIYSLVKFYGEALLIDMDRLIILFFLCFFTLFSQVRATDEQVKILSGTKEVFNSFIGNGTWAVVNVWATACSYCIHELYDMTEFYDKHKDIVVGLTVEWPSFDFPDEAHLRNFALDSFIECPLLMVNQELSSELTGKQVHMIPATYFYNPEGELVYQYNGVLNKNIIERVVNTNKSEKDVIEWSDIIPPVLNI